MEEFFDARQKMTARFLSEGAEVVITGRRQAELDSA
jgi:short-subunit dehydrogenase involved in D-alanine esterification of teichoic acids